MKNTDRIEKLENQLKDLENKLLKFKVDVITNQTFIRLDIINLKALNKFKKTYGRNDENGNLILPADDEDKDDDWSMNETD